LFANAHLEESTVTTVALFNADDARVEGCNAFLIDNIEISFKQAGNPWAKNKV
jgi:hypothetical protein